MNILMVKIISILKIFIILELVFSIAFFLRYLIFKSLFSNKTKYLYIIVSVLLFVISVYLNI